MHINGENKYPQPAEAAPEATGEYALISTGVPEMGLGISGETLRTSLRLGGSEHQQVGKGKGHGSQNWQFWKAKFLREKEILVSVRCSLDT